MTTGVSYGDIGTQFDLESAGRLMVEALYLGGYEVKETGSRRLSQGSPPAADPHPRGFTEAFPAPPTLSLTPLSTGSNTRYHPDD